MIKSKMNKIEIRLADGSVQSNGLYANGNQQIAVRVSFIKEVQDPDDEFGQWYEAPLTDSERASVTIVGYSNPADNLPVGWSCQKQRDAKYVFGLRRARTDDIESGVTGKDIIDELAESEESESRHDEEDMIFYMRSSVEGSVRLMAIIIVDGKRWTSESVSSSFIIITSVPPYRLRVTELSFDRDKLEQDTYKYLDIFTNIWTTRTYDIHMYYWLLPSDLQIVWDNTTASSPPNLYGKKLIENWLDGEARWGSHDYTWLSFDRSEVPKHLSNFGVNIGGFIKIPRTGIAIRLWRLWHQGWVAPRGEWQPSIIRICDNYGCEHEFSLHVPGIPVANITHLTLKEA